LHGDAELARLDVLDKKNRNTADNKDLPQSKNSLQAAQRLVLEVRSGV
jgi:hypothetical protein